MSEPYVAEPAAETIANLPGPSVVEFGTNWCGFCQAAQPLIDTAFATQRSIKHIKVEDGKGRPLGRQFRVKLWPTLVFMRDGKEVRRVVRPRSSAEVVDALNAIAKE